MRRPWSEHGDEATPRTPEDDRRAHALAQLAGGITAWLGSTAKPDGVKRCSSCKVRLGAGGCLCRKAASNE